MNTDWKEISINDLKAKKANAIAMGPFGSRIKKENFTDKGIPVIKGGNLNGDFILEEGFDYLTITKADELSTSNAFRRDIVITHRGTIGQVGIIPDNSKYERYVVSQSQLKVSLDESRVNPYFIYYFLRSPKGQHRLLSNASQVGVPAIAQASTSVKSILVPVPDLTVQNKIVEILLSLDYKIEANKQTNETLESMAQALFKSWFVDFDPVRAKIRAKAAGRDPQRAAMAAIAGVSLEQDWDELFAQLDQKLNQMREADREQLAKSADLFPEPMVDSELGEVPKGWEVKTAEEILKRYRAPKRVKKDEVNKAGKVVVLEQGEGIIMGYHNDKAGFNASPDNPYFIFGDHTCITHPVIEPFDIAPNVIPLQGEKYDSYWTYYAIRGLQQFQEYRRHWSELKVKEVVVPNNKLDELFACSIKPLIIKVNNHRNENLTLSQLRDTLLPKLISGEIKV